MVVRCLIAVFALLQLLLAGTGSALAQPSSPSPSLVSPRAQGEAPPRERGVIRSRSLTVEVGVLARIRNELARAPGTGQPVVISFFDDVSLLVVFTRVENMGHGTTAFYGTVPGLPFGSVVLVEGGGIVAANVVVPGRTYQIRFRGTSGHEAREVDPGVFRDHDDAVPPPRPPVSGFAPSGDIASTKAVEAILDDGSTIDVMVVYTPQAQAAAGGTASMQSQIALGIAETNGAYTNSGAIQRLRLVHSAAVAYSDSGNINTDLARLAGTADSYMDEVHALRNAWGADLVSLWVENGGGFCGVGYMMSTVSPSFASSGFNVVDRSCATGYYSFGHELGHNMGLRHDVYIDPGTTPFAYAHGYVDVVHQFRTVMAYNNACTASGVNCTRIQHFSNPTVNYSGFTTGIAATANSALALDNTRVTVASFRASVAPGSPGTISLLLGAYAVSEGGGSLQMPVHRMGGSTGAVAVTYATANGTAISGQDFTAIPPTTLSWTNGDTSIKTITVSITQDAVKEPHETFTVTLSNPTGGVVLGTSVATVTIRDDEPDSFPPGCALPTTGWTNQPAAAAAGWSVATASSSEGLCSLKSNALADGNAGQVNKAQIQFAGSFAAGNVTFDRRVSSESGWDCLRFLIDGVQKSIGGSCSSIGGIGASGEVPWGTVSVSVTAGTHTLTWSYEKDSADSAGLDAAWIDNLGLPLIVGPSCTLDLDGNSVVDPLTDGLMVIRAMLGLTGTAVTNGAIGALAARNSWAEIQPVIQYSELDVDGNGVVDAPTDGLMITRAMFGLTGSAVTNGAIGTGTPARTSWDAIRTHLNTTCGTSFAP